MNDTSTRDAEYLQQALHTIRSMSKMNLSWLEQLLLAIEHGGGIGDLDISNLGPSESDTLHRFVRHGLMQEEECPEKFMTRRLRMTPLGRVLLAHFKQQPAAREAAKAERLAATARLLPHLVEGVTTITHTRCMDLVEEHIFLGWDGPWLTGFPTSDTLRLHAGGATAYAVNDISPGNVTHLDRVPLDALDMAADEPLGRDVAELVNAGRVIAYETDGADDGDHRRFDKALEAFADRVAWDSAPQDPVDALDPAVVYQLGRTIAGLMLGMDDPAWPAGTPAGDSIYFDDQMWKVTIEIDPSVVVAEQFVGTFVRPAPEDVADDDLPF